MLQAGRLDTLDSKAAMLQGDVTGLRENVTELKRDVTGLKESHEITRNGVNALLEWSDRISEVQRFPLPKI